MKKFLLIFTFLFLPNMVFADNEFKLACDNSKLNIGDQVICRISLKSDSEYNYIKYNINEIDGLSLVDVRSNYSNLWKVGNSEALSENIVNGLQEFGILLFKADKSGEYNLSISNISFGMYESENKEEIKDVSYKIKVISNDNYLKSIVINDTQIDDFEKNKFNYVYETDLDDIKIEGIANNEFSNIKGNTKVSLNKNNEKVVVPIIVTSESGASRAYVIEVINKNFVDNKIDKNLEDLIIKNDSGDTLIFNFKSDVYDYNIEVGNKVNEVTISPKIFNKDCSFVKGYSGGKVKIGSGNNVVLIKIKDKDNQEKIYVLNIIKPIEAFSNNSYLKSIDIKGYNLKFNKKVRNYNLEISRSDKILEITPVLDDEAASYVINGNHDLKNGSIIEIVVTAPDTSNTVYTININIKKANFMFLLYIIIPISLIYLGYKYKDKIVKLIKKNKSIDELSLEELFVRYNLNYKDKGLTKFFEKLNDDNKRLILIDAINNNILVNKTNTYLELYRASRVGVKKKKSTDTKKKTKKKKK